MDKKVLAPRSWASDVQSFPSRVTSLFLPYFVRCHLAKQLAGLAGAPSGSGYAPGVQQSSTPKVW